MPGGVCAVLDYDVDLMAEYVAEMSTCLAVGSSRSTDEFRKFISRILSSTRLPRTTILLGMNYLAKRINIISIMNQNTKVAISDGQVWRLLTVALLLGSKFLDDNTFQNRSWADVSGIPVSELNTLEREWMETIKWNLYVNLDRSEDYTAWISSWNEWESTKKRQAIATRERLFTLALDSDTMSGCTMAYTTWHQQQIAEYERWSRLKRNEAPLPPSYRAREPSWPYQPTADLWSGAPLTPPDSGYGTPDYMHSATSVNTQYNDWFSLHAQQAGNNNTANTNAFCRQQYQSPVNPVPYQSRNVAKLPTYSFYGHSIWQNNTDTSNNNLNCTSQGCTTKHLPYFNAAYAYGQPVMG